MDASVSESGFHISIFDEHFTAKSVKIADQKVTGAQIPPATTDAAMIECIPVSVENFCCCPKLRWNAAGRSPH